jgi:hypothetical protein
MPTGSRFERNRDGWPRSPTGGFETDSGSHRTPPVNYARYSGKRGDGQAHSGQRPANQWEERIRESKFGSNLP